MARKTRLMRTVEDEQRGPLERILPQMVNEKGLTATADALGVSKATLGYWLLKLGLRVQRVCLAPNEEITVLKPDDNNPA